MLVILEDHEFPEGSTDEEACAKVLDRGRAEFSDHSTHGEEHEARDGDNVEIPCFVAFILIVQVHEIILLHTATIIKSFQFLCPRIHLLILRCHFVSLFFRYRLILSYDILI